MFARIITRIQLWQMPEDSRILHALDGGPQHALPISRTYAINIGRLYVRLIHMERAGLVRSGYSGPVDPSLPRRRCYWLSGMGRELVEQSQDSPMYRRLTQLVAAAQPR